MDDAELFRPSFTTIANSRFEKARHDIRIQVSIIQAAAQLLEKTGDMEEVGSFCETLRKSCTNIGSLLNELYPGEESELEEPDYVDIVALLRDFADNASVLGRDKDVNVSFGCGTRMLIIPCPRVVLTRVVMNLLSNAVKFTPPGGLVELMLFSYSSGVKIVVRDNGPGIDNINAALYRERNDGHGIGLKVVKALCEQIGGSVSFRNRRAGGLTAKITLPMGS